MTSMATGSYADTTSKPIRPATVALVGNPNAGKTSLFNALTGLRAKTANFPGTTTELRAGLLKDRARSIRVVDLPGMYSLSATTAEEKIAVDAVLGRQDEALAPSAMILILDATNLERNLFLASEVLELGIPTVVALNMFDLARKKGIRIDLEVLQRELGCAVVATSAPSRRGVPQVRDHLERLLDGRETLYRPRVPLAIAGGGDCAHQLRYEWAERVAGACVWAPPLASGSRSEAVDRWLTHPVLGVGAFLAVMFALFYLIFSLAEVPMTLIESAFGALGSWVGTVLPEGQLNSLVVDGAISGVGGLLVFLPQICILFFLITLLEDSGYLARAAFVMDRLMRRFGLPGKAFVPLLSAHACAIPGILAARVIEDRRDRLATILVLPLVTCSARLPVYAMVTALLFPQDPLKGALLFAGAYMLGLGAAISMSLVFRFTILPGRSRALILEMPSYKVPSLRNALVATYDRALVFVKNAGTVILAICIILWWLASYPQMDESQLRPQTAQQVAALRAQAASSPGLHDLARQLQAEADNLVAQEALEYSFAGRMGRAIEPVLRPLGFNWQIGVGIVTSFAARETIVSTLGVVYGVGEDVVDQAEPLLARVRRARKPDGGLVFTTATSISLLVFYVLAMQCLPTQVITRRETGTWKWALFQLGYMTVLAYAGSLVVYQGLTALGVA